MHKKFQANGFLEILDFVTNENTNQELDVVMIRLGY